MRLVRFRRYVAFLCFGAGNGLLFIGLSTFPGRDAREIWSISISTGSRSPSATFFSPFIAQYTKNSPLMWKADSVRNVTWTGAIVQPGQAGLMVRKLITLAETSLDKGNIPEVMDNAIDGFRSKLRG